MNNVLEIKNLRKSFTLANKEELIILDNINFEVQEGISLAIIGKSGCGKSTLLQIAASLMKPTSGQIILNNQDLSIINEKNLCNIRNNKMGFIFQNSLLLEDFSAIENVMMPLLIKKQKKEIAKKRALELIEDVGLLDRKDHKANALSGGEKQRIAIARALANSPSIIFADEPTGSLDESNASFVEDLLLNLVKEEKTTLILVTHNKAFAKKCDKVFNLTYGNIEEIEKEI